MKFSNSTASTRSRTRIGAAAVIAALTLTAAAACSQQSLPGTPLGTYNVTGTLGTNTCGAGLGAASPWSFTVQMSQDGSTLYWETSDGSQMSGVMSTTTQVTLESAQTSNVDATEAGEGSCNLNAVTTIVLTLGTGSPPSTVAGSIDYAFNASTGVSSTTDCTDQLSSSGGSYDTLPCTVHYTIAATHQ